MNEEPRAFGTAVPPTPLGEPASSLRWVSDGRPMTEVEAARQYAREPDPMFNSPWPVTATLILLAAVFVGQIVFGVRAAAETFGLVPMAVSAGRYEGLLSHIFLHGGWLHLFFNATALAAFGAPVARLFGSQLGGALRFAVFFLLCGLAGGLTFWALHPAGAVPLVGASGAISGLMGAAARLIERRGTVGHPFSRVALRFVLPWIVLNLLLAVAGTAFALPIAWEAHLGGLVAGWLLIGPFAPQRPRLTS